MAGCEDPRRRARCGNPDAAVRDSEDDKVVALEAGTDDCVTKPFRFRELNARLRALLALLMQHPNEPITHARLLRTIWGPEYGDEPEYLRSFVKTLRRKIEDDPSHPGYILTESWVGYRLSSPLNPAAARSRPAGPEPE